MSRPRRCTRARLAVGGLLIAFSLEICGCDPVPSCEQLLDTPLASLAQIDARADTILRCERCLTSTQVAILRRQIEQFDRGLPSVSERSKTLQEVLRDQQALSFYAPEDAARGVPLDDTPLANSAPADSKPSPWPIPESVYFVYSHPSPAADAAGQPPSATAFVISVPDKGHRGMVRFLVTARHVVDPQWANCPAPNPQTIQIRLNKWSGGVGFETIPLETHHGRAYFTPADDQSDVAIIYLDRHLIPRLDDYKFIDLPFRLLPTEPEQRGLRADLQVMTAGLSPSSQIGDRSYPAFRSGILSSLTQDPTGIQCGAATDPKSVHLWFVTGTISRGVSGAPVYASIDRFDATARLPVKAPVLLGIQSMAWPSRGLAGITPSGALRDLVQSTLADRRMDMDLYRGPGQIGYEEGGLLQSSR